MAFNNAMRSVLPDLLALSASSPWYEGRCTHLHSTRTQLFTRMFPRCGIPEPFDGWADYDRFVRWLVETRSIKEHTEIWWCVRPHQSYGTVELRNADALADVRESLAVMAYAYALSARRLRAIDEGEPIVELRGRHIEENMWRAIRWGLSGELIDYERGMASVPAAERVLAQLADAAPEIAALGLEPYLEPLHRMLESGNSAQRSIAALEAGRDARGAVRRAGARDARVRRRRARAGGGPWLRPRTIQAARTSARRWLPSCCSCGRATCSRRRRSCSPTRRRSGSGWRAPSTAIASRRARRSTRWRASSSCWRRSRRRTRSRRCGATSPSCAWRSCSRRRRRRRPPRSSRTKPEDEDDGPGERAAADLDAGRRGLSAPQR